jgi:MYXO-CTERM domain-containing protein
MVKLILALLFAPLDAHATYSIAAVDTGSGEVGGSGTSCVGNFSVSVIYGSVPGAGVVHAQAYYHEPGRDRAVELLADGLTPQEIIDDITSLGFDLQSSFRQYGVATVDGATAGFTGSSTDPWTGHRTGSVDRFAYTAQGNILTSENVLLNAGMAFEGGGCDLADRLMLALEAGALNDEGDSRCTPDGIPSDGAFIRVDRPGEPGWLDLRVDDTAPMNPLVLLRQEYDQWRATNPCVAPPPPDAGVVDTGPLDTGVVDTGAVDTGAIDTGFAEDASQKDAGTDAGQVADGSTVDVEDEGCGCSTTSAPASSSALGFLLLLLVVRQLRVVALARAAIERRLTRLEAP